MIKVTFGPTVESEVIAMLEASSETVKSARDILDNQTSKGFLLTREQATYLARQMINNCDRVSEAISPQAGTAFERAGVNLHWKANPKKPTL